MEVSKVERDFAINSPPPSNKNNSYNNPPSSTTPSPNPGIESTILSSPLETLDPVHKPSTNSPNPKSEMIRYRECQRNHAAHLGGHVVDGCGEFMPSGEEGTPLALKCAACECHRNFHRREIEGETSTTANATAMTAPPSLLPPPALPPPTTANCYISFNSPKLQKHPSVRPFGGGVGPTLPHPNNRAPVMMTFGGGAAAESSSDDLNAYREVAAGQFGDQYGSSKKRFRTKFTQEQKDKMMEFADKIGWRIQKQDDAQVQQFCAEVGVKRQVFKVWLHNNKQAIKRKQS